MLEAEKDDQLIGYRYGNANQLVVLGWNGKRVQTKWGAKLYQVYCEVCATDPELHGNAIFDCTKAFVKMGRCSCACTEKKQWTFNQYQTLINRACKEREFVYEGYVGEWSRSTTKLRIRCLKDGRAWESTSVFHLLSGDGCPSCKAKGFSDALTPDDDTRIKQFTNTSRFLPGTIFGRKDNEGNWAYKCPKCSNDEYVREGLCSGVFDTTAAYLAKGTLSCRCSQMFRWTQAQRERQIKQKAEGMEGISFVGWVNKYENCDSRILLKCDKHKEWECGVSSFIHKGTGCPRCAKSGFNRSKAAFLYVILATSSTGEFTGYGVTGCKHRRFGEHTINLAKNGFEIARSKVFEMGGEAAFQLEKELKIRFDVQPQKIAGFRKEATYGHMYETVVNFVELSQTKTNQESTE